MSNELAESKNSLRAILNSDAGREQFANALPKHLSAERFCRVAITALTRTPKLAECTRESFFKCLLDLSAMGLEPDGRRAHLIPYGKECTLIVDYKGLAELVMRSGTVSNIHADKVCENDAFEVDRGKITKHLIDFRKDRGKAYAYYALVRFKDGSEKAEVMTFAEVESIMKRSQGYKSAIQYNKGHPWLSDFDEMAKKTVFRRCSKWLSLSPEIRDALEKDGDQIDHSIRNVTPSTGFATAFADPAPALESPAVALEELPNQSWE